MLLVHQVGAVKVGEVVRYTLTYTPSNDRILPTPPHLHVKIKNTCAIPLRAAWVHGPYALHVSAYPASFNPHQKLDPVSQDGIPQYEPMLKAGGSWRAELRVPERIRETGADLGRRRSRQSFDSLNAVKDTEAGSVTWIIEIASQILFSTSASVNFEVFISRDERSLDLGFTAISGQDHGEPGHIKEKTSEKERARARKRGSIQRAGVYSKAITLRAEDTEMLWDKPPLPTWEDNDRRDRATAGHQRRRSGTYEKTLRRQRKIHLVVVTHGLHSNIGADMLYMKESIDAAAAQARLDARKRREQAKQNPRATKKAENSSGSTADGPGGDYSTAQLSGGQDNINATADDSVDEEETIVRGFPGNAVRTENGIQYLGKRLAKYILRFTYPDQPFLPVKKAFSRTFADTFKSEADKAKRDGRPAHSGSSIKLSALDNDEILPYTFTSISFIGHSLGGLIQTYAIAYIHKHNPTFFEQIKPINFVCLASPMLGLSNENPMYVRFALDFGVVGRTGQDLGLAWRTPTLAKGGWNAVMGGLGSGQKDQEQRQQDPGAKPLLRILPTGPAHHILKRFRNRTVYSNVVNDGIVPLRTSCLLFLDWRGLEKVEKARRENGLIGTVAEWGWAELTGANVNAVRAKARTQRTDSDTDEGEHVRRGEGHVVPLPETNGRQVDGEQPYGRNSHDTTAIRRLSGRHSSGSLRRTDEQQDKGLLDNFLSMFRSPNSSTDRSRSPQPISKKTSKALRRGQTIFHDDESTEDDQITGKSGTGSNPHMRPHLPRVHSERTRPRVSKGDSYYDEDTGELHAPPKTSIFESAGDLLHPPLPSQEWITDPETRAKTVFHDRVYRPEDIPPAPMRKSTSSKILKTLSFDSSRSNMRADMQSNSTQKVPQSSVPDSGGMKVEEKIARAYHRDLTWRKVLVRLEPDAHNNMIVRRMFANAYGWPVIKHLCDMHFADTAAARTPDDQEDTSDHAAASLTQENEDSMQDVETDTIKDGLRRTRTEIIEARDEVADLHASANRAASSHSSSMHSFGRDSTAVWDDAIFDSSEADGSDVDERLFVQKILNPHAVRKPEQPPRPPQTPPVNGASGTSKTHTSPLIYMDGHRGLAATSARSPASVKSPASQKSTFDSASMEGPVISNNLVEEPETMDAQRRVSAAALGLRKSIEEQTSLSKAAGKNSKR